MQLLLERTKTFSAVWKGFEVLALLRVVTMEFKYYYRRMIPLEIF